MVGTVTDIILRHTIIRNYENKMIVIPNSVINKEKVINYDLRDRKCCQYIDLAKQIMQQEAEAHPLVLDNRSAVSLLNKVPKVVVRVINLGESAVTLRSWAWARNFDDAFDLRCDLYESIKKRFDKEGVDIPFSSRTVVFKEEQLDKLLQRLHTREMEAEQPPMAS